MCTKINVWVILGCMLKMQLIWAILVSINYHHWRLIQSPASAAVNSCEASVARSAFCRLWPTTVHKHIIHAFATEFRNLFTSHWGDVCPQTFGYTPFKWGSMGLASRWRSYILVPLIFGTLVLLSLCLISVLSADQKKAKHAKLARCKTRIEHSTWVSPGNETHSSAHVATGSWRQ